MCVKKTFSYFVMASIMSVLASCHGGQKPGGPDAEDSLPLAEIQYDDLSHLVPVSVEGKFGENSMMSTIEVLMDGDTITVLKENAKFIGSPEFGDDVNLVYTDQNGDRIASLVVDYTQLFARWETEDSVTLKMGKFGKVSFSGKEGYRKWEIKDGNLLLYSQKIPDGVDNFVPVITVGADGKMTFTLTKEGSDSPYYVFTSQPENN